jgi:hypothetical protein
MSRPPTFPKKIHRQQTYYRFKLNETSYAFFDGDFDTAIFYGPLNSYNLVKRFLPKNSKIFYFKLDKTKGWIQNAPIDLITEQILQDNGQRGGFRTKNYPKKINDGVLLYFYIEVSPTIISLFDNMLDTPVAHGDKQKIAFFINNKINPNSVIFYFKKDDKNGLRYIASYKPDNSSAETSTKKAVVEKVKKEIQQSPVVPEKETA